MAKEHEQRRTALWAESPWWHIAAAAGIVVFAVTAFYFAHHQQPVLDEGTYLYKGLLFVRGVYRPFQPNGPWVNHMPLSFLIPGYVQKWFGPGLEVGRYFSVVAAVVMLLGLWLLVRRLSGRRWAAAAVWAFALMPAAAKIYSLAVSQAMVAAMLVWVLVLVVDERPARWRLGLGGVLAGLMVMTRLNMAIAWGLIGLFVAWAWPRRSVWFWGASLAVILGMHALYWPRIVWLWARWLPAGVHLPPRFGVDLSHAPRAVVPAIDMRQRLEAVTNAFVGWPLAWASLFAGTAAWTSAKPPRAFLRRALGAGLVLTWALVLLHAWASVGKSYCVDCFTPYSGFYVPLMIAVGALGLQPAWEDMPRSRLPQRLTVILFIVLMSSTFVFLLDGFMHVFRYIGLHSGDTFFQRLIAWPHFHVLPHLSVTEAGQLFWALVLLFLIFLLTLWLAKKHPLAPKQIWLVGMAMFFLSSPFLLLSGAWRPYDCAPDVLAAHRQAAEALARAIPPEATVYWAAYPPTLLLRMRGIRVFPQQLNDHYNFRNGGDPQMLASWGYWNPTLAQQWLAQANVVITDEHVLLDGPPPPFEAAGFAIRQEISLVPECLGRQGKLEIMLRSKP